MNEKKILDERVVAERREINSEAFRIVMFALLCSIFLQRYLLNAPFIQYAVELICVAGIFIYTTVRYIKRGLNVFGEKKLAKSTLLVNSIVVGIIVTASNGICKYVEYTEHHENIQIGSFITTLAITFICASISVFAVLLCLSYINTRRQAKIQKQLDENDLFEKTEDSK